MPAFDPLKIRVFLDLDDVLVDWVKATANLLALDLTYPPIRDDIETNWGMQVLEEKRMWEVIHAQGEEWWTNLPMLPWGEKLYAKLSSRWPVCILTSPSKNPCCAAGKVAWIHKYLPDKAPYLIGKPKMWCANKYSVLVDDKPANIEAFRDAGGSAFLWPNAMKTKRLQEGDKRIDECVRFIETVEMNI